MRLSEVEIDNFMGFGHARISLDDKGLVLLQGINKDDPSAESNGAGKSTLPDAIFWNAYGETARDNLAADAVVNRNVGKDCQVRSTYIEDNGDKHVITRWRKKLVGGKRSGVSLISHLATGEAIDLTKGTDKLTQAEIDKVLGCPKEVFTAAVYAGQEKLPNLPAMTDLELKKLIEEASGVTILVRAHEIAKQKLKDAEREHDVWRLDHVRLENEVIKVQDRINDLKMNQGTFEERRSNELASLQLDFDAAKARARTKQVERDSVDPERVQQELDKLDAKINAVEAENQEETRLSNIERGFASELTSKQAVLRMETDQAIAQRDVVDRIDGQVGQPCDSCGKPYETHDIEGARKIGTEKLQLLVARAKETRTDVREIEKRAQAALKDLEAYRSKKTDIRATVEERKRLALLLVQRNSAVTALERDVADAVRIRKQMDDRRSETNPFGPLVTKAEEELVEVLGAHRDSEVRGVDLERRVMVCKENVKVYGPAGVRAHVLDSVTPFLNDRTADYLGTMSDGRISAVWSTLQMDAKGELKEKFAISVQKTGDADSFAGLSGGEKRKVRLACALALQDLVASRATKPIRLWIGDEIDDALDDAGLERLMTVLEGKARERGTVLVISHNSLNDWIRETATVTREGGMSTVAGVLDVVAPMVALAA